MEKIFYHLLALSLKYFTRICISPYSERYFGVNFFHKLAIAAIEKPLAQALIQIADSHYNFNINKKKVATHSNLFTFMISNLLPD